MTIAQTRCPAIGLFAGLARLGGLGSGCGASVRPRAGGRAPPWDAGGRPRPLRTAGPIAGIQRACGRVYPGVAAALRLAAQRAGAAELGGWNGARPIHTQADEREWLCRARRGDDAAARLLYARFAPGLFAYARAILRDAGYAEDAVHNAFLRVYRTPARTIDSVRSPQALLITWTRREALTALRAERRRQSREDRWRVQRLRERWAADNQSEDFAGEVRDAVDRLPRKQREVVVLKHVSQMTFDQMALALRVNRNTVASRYRSAMFALRGRLSRDSHIAGKIHVG